MMIKKRGAVEMQFNWIFILIAGSVILLLFTMIAIRQKDAAQNSYGISAANGLEAVLFGKENAAGTMGQVEIPEAKIEFNCNSYSIMGASKSIGNMNLFMPSKFEGNKLFIMSREWNAPYAVSNFLYLTSPKVQYIFIGNSLFARMIFENIPDAISKEGYTTAGAIQNENYGNVRIIFFDQLPIVPETLKGMKNRHLTALSVQGNNNYGTVEFFDFVNGKFESKGTSFYLGEPSLLGAIFSDSLRNYNCSMGNAFVKLNILSRVYVEKIEKTLESYSNQDNKMCWQLYNEIAPESSKLLLRFSTAGFGSGDGTANAMQDLGKYNAMAKSLSCVSIY